MALYLSKNNFPHLIEVKDNGIGIAPDKQAYVFDKFYRVTHGNKYTVKALENRAFVEKQKEVPKFEIGNYLFDSVTQKLLHAGIEVELSHCESEILKRLCRNRNNVVETQSILLDLWGDDSIFNVRSLHVFITKLRHKLSKDSRIKVINIRGIGYKLIVS